MATGKWKVFGSDSCGTKLFQVGRMRDVTGPIDASNMEYYGGQTADKWACIRLANLLNKQERQRQENHVKQ